MNFSKCTKGTDRAKPPQDRRLAQPFQKTSTTFPALNRSSQNQRASRQKITGYQSALRVGSQIQKEKKQQSLVKKRAQEQRRNEMELQSSKNISKKKQIKPKSNWDKIPLNLLLIVADYSCMRAFDVYQFSLICQTWRNFMECENARYLWIKFDKTTGAKSFEQYKACLIRDLQELKKNKSIEFEKYYTKLFNYGSTKQNIPNKLISKLKLELEVTINGKKFGGYKFKLRHFNFSSYLYAKISELSSVNFDMYTPHNLFKDKLAISIRFYSRSFKVSHQINYSFLPSEIVECAIKQKAFNYFLSKNLILTFFEGDNSFLYCFLEISLLELITQFRKIIKNSFSEHIEKKVKKLPLHKKLCETEFDNFVEYLKYQADFQLHMSYHNSQQQIFTHCDTKVYPIQYDHKKAYFYVPIDDTFPKTSTFLLDNKMGMSESIQNLYLLDFVLKDRDRFLIVFSGFIYARKASKKERQSVDDYFNFAEMEMKVLEFKGKGYESSILIIEQNKKNLIKWAKFTIYPS